MHISRLFAPALLSAALLLPLSPVLAQGGPGYFIPPTAQPPSAAGPRVAPRPAPRPSQVPTVRQYTPPPPPAAMPGQVAGPTPDEANPPQIQLPPLPDLPALPRGSAPPAAVIGVLGIPEIMRASTAAQQVEKIITERREKLNEDAQKEQLVWREMQQALANQRGSLNAEQVRGKERELQDRITNAQRVFRDRNRIIQEAGQYGLAQIERALIQVIRQVAESRGMNLVLHRAQVALNVNEFDMTDQVAAQMNKVLPNVVIPPEGVSPLALSQSQAPAPGATPVAAPGGAAPGSAPAPGPAAGPAPSPAPAPAPARPAPAGGAPRR